MAKVTDRIIAALFLIMACLLVVLTDWKRNWYWIALAVLGAGLHLWTAAREEQTKNKAIQKQWSQAVLPPAALTELVLLSEDNTKIASWNIYGKTGLVIGRDVGENHVNINLNEVTYASMISIEHAVLNYSGDSWYIEDISEKNGVSIEKRDGKKYKPSYGKPCRLEKGDIIYIALTRLQIL